MKLWGFKGRNKCKAGNVLKVGVMGSARGVGTTHFSVMLANYYRNGCGLKTCLVEFNGHKDYMKICDEAGIEVKDIRQYSYKGIEFRVCQDAKAVADCVTGEYEVVIIDMASEKEETLEELKRCDIRWLVGSTDMWRIGRFKKLISELENISISLAVFLGNQTKLRKLKKEYKVSVFEVPIEPNPFEVQSKTMYMLKEYLADVPRDYISQ